jgi:predicted xylose isomerase-like sugar epimerase
MSGLSFEKLESQEKVRKQIQACEGKHSQQVVYSTFHDALTQICYGCKKVRSNKGFL